MAAIVEQMGGCHPDEPHWYLPFIGVTPARQGRGYGAALLRAQLSICDKAQLPAYLESTSPKSQPLYERHGFRAIAEIKVGSRPPIVPMLRRPDCPLLAQSGHRSSPPMSAIGGKADMGGAPSPCRLMTQSGRGSQSNQVCPKSTRNPFPSVGTTRISPFRRFFAVPNTTGRTPCLDFRARKD